MATRPIELFYDGACGICSREVRALRRLDGGGRLVFVDIAEEGFDASVVGVPWERLNARIHARLPDGTIAEGVEVFRHVYTAVGFSRLVALTRLPGVRQALDVSYHWFARNRRWLSGRSGEPACGLPAPARPVRSAPM